MQNIKRRDVLSGLGLAASGLGVARADSASPGTDVVVIGAGLSGLYAALMLQDAGMKVRVLEGSTRVGGRCMTARDLPGRPELGASQVGAMYARIRAMAARFNVALASPPAGTGAETRLPQMAISLGGRPIDQTPWAQSPQNPLPPAEHTLLPSGITPHYLRPLMSFKSVDDWMAPQFRHFDTQSLADLLRSQGASDPAIRLADFDTYAGSCSAISALEVMRKQFYYGWEALQGPFDTIVDGTSSVPEAMARGLHVPVAFSKFVTSITVPAKGKADIVCEDGTRIAADHVVCTLPFSVLRDVHIDAPLPAAQRRAIAELPYAQIVSGWVSVKKPYWEADGLPVGLWSDGPTERMFATPSRVQAAPNLSFYLRGAHGAAVSRMKPADAERFLLDELARIRPSTKGTLEFLRLFSWENYRFNRGAYAFFAPGQVNDFADVMARPCGCLHFAGEHTGRLSAGMEAACESGERAALEVLGLT